MVDELSFEGVVKGEVAERSVAATYTPLRRIATVIKGRYLIKRGAVRCFLIDM